MNAAAQYSFQFGSWLGLHQCRRGKQLNLGRSRKVGPQSRETTEQDTRLASIFPWPANLRCRQRARQTHRAARIALRAEVSCPRISSERAESAESASLVRSHSRDNRKAVVRPSKMFSLLTQLRFARFNPSSSTPHSPAALPRPDDKPFNIAGCVRGGLAISQATTTPVALLKQHTSTY